MSRNISNAINEVISRININMNNIVSTDNINTQISEMNKAFSLTRKSLILFPEYEQVLVSSLKKCNRQMSDFHIMAFNPNFKPLSKNEVNSLRKRLKGKYPNSYSFLDDFIKLIRTEVSQLDWSKYDTIYFKKIKMNRYHFDICKLIKSHLEELGITSKIINIHVGFDKDSKLANRLLDHPFNLVFFNGSKFIIDLSYQDFFLLKDNMLNSLGIQGYPLPLPGIYMIQNKSRMETAGDLLNNGYIEFNNKNFKNYLDGFSLSFRNGLFYEQQEVNYSTTYTVDEYSSFLSGKDSQLKREGSIVLGMQGSPLEEDINYTDGFVIYQSKSKKMVKTI